MRGALSRNGIVVLVVLAALGLDQLTKYLIIQNVPLYTSWPDEGFFRFTHVANTGSAFGLFGDQNIALIGASFVGLGVLYYFYRVHPNPSLLVRISLGLMLAGALGNLIDRLAHGHVTDFIDIGPWWIFNLADSSIVGGLIVLASSMVLGETPAEHADAPGEPVPLADPTGGVFENTPADAPNEPVSEDHGASTGR